MSTATDQAAVLDEQVWSAWLRKSELAEQATARKAKVTGAIVLLMLAIGFGVYRLAM